jgi:hypothetical protein
VTEIGDRTEGRVRTQNELQDTGDQLSLDIPDQGSARENLRVLTERLRARIAIRRAQASAQADLDVAEGSTSQAGK